MRGWRSTTLALALVAVGFGCKASGSGQPPAEPVAGMGRAWHSHVRIDDPQLRSMDVQICWRGPAPARIVGSRRSSELIGTAWGPNEEELERIEASFVTAGLPADACMHYEVDLLALGEQGRATRAARIGRDLVAASELWLWHPPRPAAVDETTLSVELPDGYSTSFSWPNTNVPAAGPERAGLIWSLDPTAYKWRTNTAFGRFAPWTFEQSGTRVSVTVLDARHRATRAGIETWLRTAIRSVASLYGEFPRESVQVLVVPVNGRGSEPVHFGMAARGGGASVVLLLDAYVPDQELPGEWVAVHELLHLCMPFVESEDRWLGEGFVTYYQEVLRGRTDTFPGVEGHEANVRTAIEKLRAGFVRARRAGGRSLAKASARMHQDFSYTRVYWHGAAVAWDVDRRLRENQEGSLDHVMRIWRECCVDQRRYGADELFDQVADEFPRSELERLLERHLASTAPSREIVDLEGVGVQWEGDSAVLQDTPAAAAQLRDRLFSASPAP